MFTSLEGIATVSLGFKSLQNGFFYVSKATIDTYGIEKRFLVPILRLRRDLDSTSYQQKAKNKLWLFYCREQENDLRGTGALRYIEAMSYEEIAQVAACDVEDVDRAVAGAKASRTVMK
jgi:hypothetical protein